MADRKLSFSKKQLQVLTWWQNPKWDAVICDGAVRSGKTFAMGLGFFLWAQARFDGKQFGLCGKTIASLRRNLLAELIPWLRRQGMVIQEHRKENLLAVRFHGRENKFLLFGGRDESSAALIQGSTLAGVLLDEAALMPRSFVEQALARCSVEGSKLWFNCNPDGINKLSGKTIIKIYTPNAGLDTHKLPSIASAKKSCAPVGLGPHRRNAIPGKACLSSH